MLNETERYRDTTDGLTRKIKIFVISQKLQQKIPNYLIIFHVLKWHSFHKHFPKYDSKGPYVGLLAVTSPLKTFPRFPWTPGENNNGETVGKPQLLY